jgi:uncharacterized protein YjbI with pentapeptide repeats
MANQDHVARLKQGVVAWNAWRRENETVVPDLMGANLSGINLDGDLSGLSPKSRILLVFSEAKLDDANLGGANLSGAVLVFANLSSADLREAKLDGANLGGANLSGANLSHANLRHAILGSASGALLLGANLSHANLGGADLSGAVLLGANLSYANLGGANLGGAALFETLFTNVDLSNVIGLDTCEHLAPSSIDHRTLEQSPNLPLAFLRGVGLPDRLIDYLPSLLNQPSQFYSCFISYSAKDDEFRQAHLCRPSKQRGALLVRSA